VVRPDLKVSHTTSCSPAFLLNRGLLSSAISFALFYFRCFGAVVRGLLVVLISPTFSFCFSLYGFADSVCVWIDSALVTRLVLDLCFSFFVEGDGDGAVVIFMLTVLCRWGWCCVRVPSVCCLLPSPFCSPHHS
jgi:hypothetical protein